MRELRASLAPEVRREFSRRICLHLVSLKEFQEAGTILFFVPFDAEVDLLPALGRALLEGKRVGLPRTLISRKALVFHQLFTLGELVPGPYGIPEPPATNPRLFPERSELILVPGLAFDRRGYRLGYGGGFYDRVLGRVRALKVAPAFSLQIVEEIPREEHDLPVDVLVTEEGVFRVSG